MSEHHCRHNTQETRTAGTPMHRSAQAAPAKLLSRDFILLFCLSMCSNANFAVFYCLEQWLEGMAVSPDWRGTLISVLFGMVLLTRPLASVFLLKRNLLQPMFWAVLLSGAVMLVYPFVQASSAVSTVLILRMVQGASLAVYSCCAVAVLVNCIPPGQSARGFALFSLTMLLPYSTIPALGEELLPLIGGEPYLFAWTGLLAVPALLMLIPLAPRLRQSPAAGGEQDFSMQALWRGISGSGLFLVFAACLFFSMLTMQAIFFIKGLCTVTGAKPAWFFTTYTITIMTVRVVCGSIMDKLPRHPVILLCCVLLGNAMLGLAWAPLWAFIPLTISYGIGLGLLYPLLASFVYDRSTAATRAINSNIMMSTFDASGMLGPLLGGMIVNAGFGYRGVFVGMTIIIALCGLAMLIDALRNRSAKQPA